jgi:RND family efflux transporter MFP subunit
MYLGSRGAGVWLLAITGIASLSASLSCRGVHAGARQLSRSPSGREVGVIQAARKTLERTLTISSELVPFQQIDVYAKESGFIRKLYVDYGSRVKAGQVMAALEIPELQKGLDEDEAEITAAAARVDRTRKDLDRLQVEHNVLDLAFTRLNGVAQSHPGLVTQQEVDDANGKDLSAQAQVDAAESDVASAQSEVAEASAKRLHDEVLLEYSKITAPFQGVVTQRYANLGALMQAATNSSTQAMALVQLSEDDRFRLVLPVSESYVPYIQVGDSVEVRVPALGRSFPGRVARSSQEVNQDTRTMHTEVDVPNPQRILLPGLYAEATLTLDRKQQAITVPPEAINLEGEERSVWVVDARCRLAIRNVTLGIETPNDVEVLSGLKEGELVAVGERSSFRVGEPVRPKIVQLIQGPPPEE